MYILGLNTGLHDTSATLLVNGNIDSIIEQERISRNKKAFNESPSLAISACLQHAKITLKDIDVVAVGWDMKAFKETYNEKYDKKAFYNWIFPPDLFSHDYLPPIRFVPHHLAHAASAFWTSGFESAAILTIDGRGETEATTTAFGNSDGIQLLSKMGIEQSLGNFYGIAAEWAGFSYWDTGKLMGLASYGNANQPIPLEPSSDGYRFVGLPPSHSRVYRHYMQQRIMLVRHFLHNNYPFCWGKGETMAYANFAASVQQALEDAVLRLARLTCEQTGQKQLVLAGGVAMNCSMNGRLARSGYFQDIYVPPIPFDAGASLGAALFIHNQIHGYRKPSSRMKHAYWAPALPEEMAEKALAESGLSAKKLNEADLMAVTAKHLAAGHIVGWMQGRAEIGQRALGSRSILCDPRDRYNLTRLNKLKGREIWRPLAPSVLEEYTEEIFGPGLSQLADFMLAAWPVLPAAQHKIPVCVHVDGTARPQIVRKSTHKRYWELINAFREISDIPVIVNTSFNLAGEPIVYTPKDAIHTFLRSELDVLVLEDFIVERSNAILS